MRTGSRRSDGKRQELTGRARELGGLLADLRTAKGLSLREVEEASGRAVSNAYPSQLESGKIDDDLTAEEEELLKYLAFLRFRGVVSALEGSDHPSWRLWGLR